MAHNRNVHFAMGRRKDEGRSIENETAGKNHTRCRISTERISWDGLVTYKGGIYRLPR